LHPLRQLPQHPGADRQLPWQGASWSWIWTADGKDTIEANVYITFWDGTKASDWAYPGTGGNSKTYYNSDVRSIHICEKYNIGWFPPVPAHTCSQEYYLV
jgi:hypothetical protein